MLTLNHRMFRTLAGAVVLSAGMLLAQAPGATRPISATKAENLAERFALNASTLSVFDRQGKLVTTVEPRAMYGATALSPDGKRLAVVKVDLENESRDIWVVDLATGSQTRATTSAPLERAFLPAWSPDGRQIAYGALRRGNFGLYRTAATGQGAEELLYQLPGVANPSDWSMDGRFLSFVTNELKAGGALHVLPLDGAERKPVEVYRSKRQLSGGFFSPDNRYLAFASNDSGINEVFVIARDGSGAPVRISDHVAAGVGPWRRDGRELYFATPDQSVMAVDIGTSPTLTAGKPRRLFRQSAATHTGFTISRDGERIVMAHIPSRLRQITIFDRQGRIVTKAGEPGFYLDPTLSPDGTRVAVERRDPVTGAVDIWTMEVTSGKTHAVTRDNRPKFDAHWNPDGSQVAYEAELDEYTYIFSKAWNGSGPEELLFRDTPGAGMSFLDWSPDGKFLMGSTGTIHLIPLRAGENAVDRKAIDWLREEYDAGLARFSPDTRHVAYLGNEADVNVQEVYIRAFAGGTPVVPGAIAPVHVPMSGARALLDWRSDGRELYFVTRRWEVAAVEITTGATLQVSAPKVLFKLPGPLQGDSDSWKNVNATGDRFVFALPLP